MKHIKTYEHIHDEIRPYLIDKFVIVKPVQITDYYLLEIKERMINDQIMAKKLYKLRKDGSIRKSGSHDKFWISPERLKEITIYKSNDLKKSYDVLKSIYDANKYNL